MVENFLIPLILLTIVVHVKLDATFHCLESGVTCIHVFEDPVHSLSIDEIWHDYGQEKLHFRWTSLILVITRFYLQLDLSKEMRGQTNLQ